MVVLWVPLIVAAGLASQASSAHLPRDWARSAATPVESNVPVYQDMPLYPSNRTGVVLLPSTNTTVERIQTDSSTSAIAPNYEEALPAEAPSSNGVDVVTNDMKPIETATWTGYPTLFPAGSAIIGEQKTPYECESPVTVTVTRPRNAKVTTTKDTNVDSSQSSDIVVTSTATSSITLTLQDGLEDAIPSMPVIGGHNVDPITRLPDQTSHIPHAPMPSSSFGGYGRKGWNTSTSTTRTAYSSIHPIPLPTGNLNKRQDGNIVVVTMDGRVVSWINEWDGKPTSSVEVSSAMPAVEPSKTSAAPSRPTCGETGRFNIHFDDLPAYSASNDTASSPPIFSPYRHLFWSSGWSYGPPPRIPFTPHSNSHVGVYTPGQASAGEYKKGGFGCGARAQNEIYWFDVSSAYFGCSGTVGNKTCVVHATASKFSEDSKSEVSAGNATFIIPPCSGNGKCEMTPIKFGDDFRGITNIKFEAKVLGKVVKWYVDDLQLKWHDDSCEAGLRRQRTRK